MANQSPSGKGPNGGYGAGPEGATLNGPEGLGPVLDLLGKMEDQVGSIAQNRPAESAASSQADQELQSLREELLAVDQRGYQELTKFVDALEALKKSIPAIIDETVNHRFLEIEDSFHSNIKEIHSRSIESFTQSVQSKIGQRIAALENNLSIHTEAMGQLREHYLKTDRNVQRLMSGLDRLTAELMRISSGAAPAVPRTGYSASTPSRMERTERPPKFDFRPITQMPDDSQASTGPENANEPKESPQRIRKKKARRRSAILIPILALLILVPIGLVGWAIRSGGGLTANRPKEAVTADKPLTGVAGQMRMAADFAADKNYSMAESTYRLILKSEPNNRQAIKELASVLFRQQRYDEAAAVLKTLPPE